jgi:amino acid permease
MPINVADLPWQAIGLLAGLTFVASLIGHSLTRNAFVGAIIAVIIFLAIYIGWDYYPHGLLGNIRFPNQFVPPR